MRIPHDKCLLSVAKIAFPLLLMQYRFFWNPKTASQVAFFQTQTFLQSIDPVPLRKHQPFFRPWRPADYGLQKCLGLEEFMFVMLVWHDS